MSLTIADIEKAAEWSVPSEVQTKYGPRMLSKASPTESFSALWKSQKDAVKALGAGFSKDRYDKWELVWWRPLDEKIVAERAEALEQSRAAWADIDLPCPDGLEYMPFQKAGIRYALQRDNVLIADQMGLGKEQPVDTRVATPDGWCALGDIAPGDAVIGSSGQSVHVRAVYPQGCKPAYRVTMSDGTSVEAGADHLWIVHYLCGGRRWEALTLTTQQLLERPTIIRQHSNGRTTRLDLSRTPLRVPMLQNPIHYRLQDPLPIPPYTLGQLIANGYLGGCSATLSVYYPDTPELLANIAQDGNSDVGAVRQYGNVAHITIKGVMPHIRALNLNVKSVDKFIPDLYLYASPRDRIALLHGLMDGDGSISKTNNRITYHTCSQQLAHDVAELAEGLGGIGTVKHYTRSDGKPDEYSVRMRLPAEIPPFTIVRKASRYCPGRLASPKRFVSSVEYVRDVEQVCIAVDAEDSLYCTEHCILTHNTIEAIAVINADDSIKSALVICPKSLKLNWLRECQRWITRNLDVAMADTEWPETDIVIVHYESLGKFEAFLQFRDWDACIIDECHLIKSPKALRSKRAKAVNARRKIRLTGTPIVNRPAELWNIIEDLTPIFGAYGKFVYRYANAYQSGWGLNADGSSRLDELQRRLRESIMVRRTKDEVLTELPRKIRQVIEIEADSAEQRRAVSAESDYELSSEDRLAELRALAELSKAEGDEAYRSAVQRLKDASQVDFTELSKLRHETALAKVPAVVDHVKSILDDGDDKVVVMIHHHDVADAMMDGLKAFNPVMLTGRDSLDKRQSAIDAFQSDDSVRVFVGSIMAAGVGITLTAASIVVFAELDWVPGNISQAEDRLHRIGQLFTVLVQHIVLRGSIDARMAKVLVEKQRVIDDALDTEHEAKKMPVFEPREKSATANVKTSDLDTIANLITPEQHVLLHLGLRQLAGLDTDYAQSKNDMGFSKIDVRIGHSLAESESLSPKQAALGYKLLRKYHRQLSEDVNIAISAIDQAQEERKPT